MKKLIPLMLGVTLLAGLTALASGDEKVGRKATKAANIERTHKPFVAKNTKAKATKK